MINNTIKVDGCYLLADVLKGFGKKLYFFGLECRGLSVDNGSVDALRKIAARLVEVVLRYIRKVYYWYDWLEYFTHAECVNTRLEGLDSGQQYFRELILVRLHELVNSGKYGLLFRLRRRIRIAFEQVLILFCKVHYMLGLMASPFGEVLVKLLFSVLRPFFQFLGRCFRSAFLRYSFFHFIITPPFLI